MRIPQFAVFGLAALIAGSLPVAAQDATPAAGFDPVARFPAHILAGGCGEPEEVLFDLAEGGFGLPAPIASATPAATARYVGPDAASPAIVSVTTLDSPLTELAAGGHAIDAHTAGAGDDAETRIVCGPVGGFLSGNDLVFGLPEAGGSGYTGIAWLHDNGDDTTTVSLFLSSGPPRGGEGAPAANDAAGTLPEAVAAAEPLVPLPSALDVTGAVIENQHFATEEIRLLAGIPSVMHIANGDDRAYRFRVVDLITTTALPAGELTVIELTTPTTGIHEGQLLAADSDDVLDVVPVIINEYEPFA